MKRVAETSSDWLTTRELCEHLKMCRSCAVKFAYDHHAVRKVSTRKNLYSRSEIDRALSRL